MEESLHNEIMILKAFNHDNIVKLFVIYTKLLYFKKKFKNYNFEVLFHFLVKSYLLI